MMVAARRLAAGIALAGVAASGAQAADVVLSTAQAGTPTGGAATNTTTSATTSNTGANAPVISSGASLAQAGLGLFAVIALILAMAWVARRVGLVRQGSGNASMKVVGSLMLGPRQRVVTVEVGGTWLVLGVSPNEIRPLHTLEAQPHTSSPDDSRPGSQADSGVPRNMQGGFGERLMRAMQENLKK
ncbi:flagellar protein FliO/FliZ [Cupriavidus metallidurans]|jgi:flagellar protein FliO/FliZ|uniref:flagellar biosynthetic protein FliO n=1 Tax=Cupriavidus TaxID=106589 RepID=UPI000493AF6D|nr:flagellar biosynthetic protein FliO [Cupriavidus metallidurans]AVA35723.1 flagellar biosynthetic protein FliO [Cupriavidus metallidurans]KWW35572.1 Flagellar protein FliO [Cupriavidus metallidurans]MDE4921711.1 flagellar biosynthetic protein FliO [Cupriavidus metallidurans]